MVPGSPLVSPGCIPLSLMSSGNDQRNDKHCLDLLQPIMGLRTDSGSKILADNMDHVSNSVLQPLVSSLHPSSFSWNTTIPDLASHSILPAEKQQHCHYTYGTFNTLHTFCNKAHTAFNSLMGFSTADRLHLNGNTAVESAAQLFPLPVSMSSENSLLIPLILSRESGMQNRSVLISYNEQASRVANLNADSTFRNQISSGTEFTFPRKTHQQVSLAHQVVPHFRNDILDSDHRNINMVSSRSSAFQVTVMKSTKVEQKALDGNHLESFSVEFTQPSEIVSSIPHGSLTIVPCTKENLDTFLLMPTPAQRGMAKGQLRSMKIESAEKSELEKPETVQKSRAERDYKELNETIDVVNVSTISNRLSSNESPIKKLFKRNDESMDRVLNQVDFEKKFANLPAFTPDDPQKGTALDFCTATLPSTPSALLRTILEKQKCSKGDYDRKEALLNISHTVQSKPRTPAIASARYDSSFFFGSNFSPLALHDHDDSISPLLYSPRTPKTPLDSSTEKSSSRKLLDHRRQLVVELLEEYGMFPSGQAISAFQNKYRQFFPNKQTLTLKIREMRQKMMASMQSPTTPSADCSFSQKQSNLFVKQSVCTSSSEHCCK
ncbi:unnamed protein product [Brugia timori]|uniref:DUF4210 domain-containing protein n=1 Tax=Brugia timori TaxID=42155 RepID=A0A0R3QRD5_9BILA|nr:unnamed protein product [Brugia timori]